MTLPAHLTSEELYKLINPLPDASYHIEVLWAYLPSHFAQLKEDYGLDLCPDFQRGHVWTTDQQTKFIEACLSNRVREAGLTVQFNCPVLNLIMNPDKLPTEVVCLDGLQRITAIEAYLAGTIKPFGLSVHDLKGTEFSGLRGSYRLRLEFFSYKTRAEVLSHYLRINEGGTPHTAAELERVRGLLDQSQTPK